MENQTNEHQKPRDGESKHLTAMQKKLKDPPAYHCERGKGMTRKIFMKKKRPGSEQQKTKGKGKQVRKSINTERDDSNLDESDDKVDDEAIIVTSEEDVQYEDDNTFPGVNDKTVVKEITAKDRSEVKVDVGTAVENDVDDNDGKDTSLWEEGSTRENNDTTVKDTVDINSMAAIIVEIVINNTKDCVCNTVAELNAAHALDIDDIKKSSLKNNEVDDKNDVTFTNEDLPSAKSTAEHIDELDGNTGVDTSNSISNDQDLTSKNDHPNTECLDDSFVNMKSDVNIKDNIDFKEENKVIVNTEDVTVKYGSVDAYDSTICDNACSNGDENATQQENNDGGEELVSVTRDDKTHSNKVCDPACDDKSYASDGDDLALKSEVGVTNVNRSDVNDVILVGDKTNVSEEKVVKTADSDDANTLDYIVNDDSSVNSGIATALENDIIFNDCKVFTAQGGDIEPNIVEDCVIVGHGETDFKDERDIPTFNEELSISGVKNFTRHHDVNIKEADDKYIADEISNDTISITVTNEDNIEEDLNLQNKVDINDRELEENKNDTKYIEEYTFRKDVNDRSSLISAFIREEYKTEYRLLSSIKPYIENKDKDGCLVAPEETEIKTGEKSRKCVYKKERSRLRRWFRRIRSGMRHFCCSGSKEEML